MRIKMKNIIQWLIQILTQWLLWLIVFYWFMEHNNFLTIIFMVLCVITTLIFNTLVKKGILLNIFEKNKDSNDRIIEIVGSLVLFIFAFYVRDTGTGRSIFYFTFFIFSLFYIVGQYKKLKNYK